MTEGEERLLVQIGTYNTNLQGGAGLPQDLVDWLSPTLHVSSFLSKNLQAPDIVAIGFQELLPLHLGLAGLSSAVIDERDVHIRTQIEVHAPNYESYSLVAKVVNVGVALLVYARDDTVARCVHDVQTQWTGCGPAYMGNKGAVGVRFRVSDRGSKAGEVFTFVCAHLTAHEPNLAYRIANYDHIVRTLLFAPMSSSANQRATTIYSTSHLFFFGDLNFRVTMPPRSLGNEGSLHGEALSMLTDEKSREALKEFDQLRSAWRGGRVFVGLREGPFWTFKCTYKYELGEIDKYNTKRSPSWTDRILYATYTDSPASPEHSNINNISYTSVPSYTTSDHKPVVSMLLLPPPVPATSDDSESSETEGKIPVLQLPSTYIPTPDPLATLKRYIGRILDRIIGYIWAFFTIIGAGSAVVGIFNLFCGYVAWMWWWKTPAAMTPVEVD
ncbi:inositol polyphosphate phosphatase [Pisolithus orientalis]|uniref:inositol polyphosphate phosphatase n=1 Tax=Pisolithus orientalis TaxID=936130 RepID=UPI0022241F40|nr:inositol polyphosphate phosphatase [Pisolithus orientalis]KAI6028661.1 inositol polyphosphate phosphatase [Pisolithus orientalis]